MPEIIDTYRTLKSFSKGIYKEKGSKFLAFAYPVKTEDEIKEKLDLLRKDHHGARHHCYAWLLGANKNRLRANDDGEPSNSAGKPILGRIDSHDLTQLLIIVVRYFGGIKLGVGGLINAYRSAAEDAINNGEIIELRMKTYFWVKFGYENMNDVMHLVKSRKIEQIEQDFALKCKLKLAVPQREFASIKSVFLNFENIGVEELFTA